MANTTAMDQQMTKYYRGMLGATTATSLRRSWPPPAHGSHGDQSWEEMAFARDAAGHLVWPPRSYTCNLCRREFRSAQALGGHMNVHRRDRARLRQCASPPDHHQDQQEAPCLFRTANKAALFSIPKSTGGDHQDYLSTITMEDQINVSSAAATARRKEAALESDEEEEEEAIMAERRKRRRVVDQPPEVVFPFFVGLPAPSCKRDDQHVAKVPNKVTRSLLASAHFIFPAGKKWIWSSGLGVLKLREWIL